MASQRKPSPTRPVPRPLPAVSSSAAHVNGNGSAPVPTLPPAAYVLPRREWLRATDLVSMFVATGWLANERSQSLLLVGEPSSGKTELLNRFAFNDALYFTSDMTITGLYRVLRMARKGTTTHVVASEFQKMFMRRSDAVQNFLGTLSQAMDEGVHGVDVGPERAELSGARLGFLGAITPESYREQERFLRRLGFLSRLTALPWSMRQDELFAVMDAISKGDTTDLAPVVLVPPRAPVHVHLPEPLSSQIQQYVWRRHKQDTILRLFKRFRALAMACAVLDRRDVVHANDLNKVFAFEPYWSVMHKG